MNFFAIFAILNVIACIAAWATEAKSGIQGFMSIGSVPMWKKPVHLIKTVFGFVPLVIDIAITVGLISIFNFGGWYAGVLGLFASNLVSAVLIYVINKMRTKEVIS